MEKGLMVLIAGPNVLRMAPSLIISDEDIDNAVKELRNRMAQYEDLDRVSHEGDFITLETIEVSTDQVGVMFENNNQTLVLTFSNDIDRSMHSVIDIHRINDLEYKTRVMRYFGGLLVTHTHNFENLVVVVDGERMEYEWNRANVHTVVKKMCHQAEMMI